MGIEGAKVKHVAKWVKNYENCCSNGYFGPCKSSN